MKARVRIAWAILAIVLALAVGSQWAVDRACRQALAQLDAAQASALAGDYTAAGAQLRRLADDFDARMRWLELVWEKGRTAEIAVGLHGLAAYANGESLHTLCSEIDRLACLLRLIRSQYRALF